MNTQPTQQAGDAAPPPPPELQRMFEGLDSQVNETPGPGAGAEAPGMEPPAPGAWKETVIEAIEEIKAAAPNWRWPAFGLRILSRGVERKLDEWMPGGLDNIGAWGPWGMILVGALIVILANLEEVEVDGVRKRRIRALVADLEQAEKKAA